MRGFVLRILERGTQRHFQIMFFRAGQHCDRIYTLEKSRDIINLSFLHKHIGNPPVHQSDVRLGGNMIRSEDTNDTSLPDVLVLPDFQALIRFEMVHGSRVNSDWSYPRHIHPSFEINLVLEGRQLIEFPETSYVLGPGDLLIIPSHKMHSCRAVSNSGMLYFCVHFDVADREFFYQITALPQLYYPHGSQFCSELRTVLDRLIRLSKLTAAHSIREKLELRLTIFEMFVALSKQLIRVNANAPNSLERDSSLENALPMHYREELKIHLEKRVQDFFHEDASHLHDESLFPPFRWIAVVSVISLDEILTMSLARYDIKTRLAATFSAIGTPVVVVEDDRATCVTFVNQITAPDIEPLVESLTNTVQTLWSAGKKIRIGGVSSRLSDIQQLYGNSIAVVPSVQSTDRSYKDIRHLTRRALYHIQEEFADVNFSLSLLAERLQVNASYLSSLFKLEIGQTFTQLVTYMRMEEAKRLLTDTDLKIYQICEKVGYTDHAYFSRIFKMNVGVSPFEYRETQSVAR